MKTWIIAASTSVAMGLSAVPAYAQSSMKMSQAECQSLWKQADAGSAGSLSSTQAQPYVSDFKSVDGNGDGKLSSAEFLAGCQKGMIKSSASTGAASGASGSTGSTTPAPDNPPRQ